MKLLYHHYAEKIFKKMMITVYKIIDLKTFQIRQDVLQSEKPIRICSFDRDTSATTI